jgi:hypothetical protein
MSVYPNQTGKTIQTDILKYKICRKINYPVETKEITLDCYTKKDNNILSNSYETFIQNLINPDAEYTRLLLYHGVGSQVNPYLHLV